MKGTGLPSAQRSLAVVLVATLSVAGCATMHARKKLTFVRESAYTEFEVSRAVTNHGTLFVEIRQRGGGASPPPSAVLAIPVQAFQRELQNPLPRAMRLIVSWNHPDEETYHVQLSPSMVKPARTFPSKGIAVPIYAQSVSDIRAGAIGPGPVPCLYALRGGPSSPSILAVALPGATAGERRIAFITGISERHRVGRSYALMSLAVALDIVTSPLQLMLVLMLQYAN